MDWLPAFLIDRIVILIAALAISASLLGMGRLRRLLLLHHIQFLLQRLVRGAETRLNRDRRSAGTRVYRGIILLLAFLLLAILPGLLILLLQRAVPEALYLEMLVLAALLPVRALYDETRGVSRALKAKQMALAQGRAAMLARREHGELDTHSIVRVTIEYLMENLSDKVIAPALWYLVLGLPGAAALRMVNLLDGLLGYRSRRYLAFGWASARLDDLLQLVPARLTGLLICLGAPFAPRGRPLQAVRILWRDRTRTSSPNAGWPLAAAAGALRLTLAGPRRVGEGVVRDAWIGDGSARATRRDLSRAQWLYWLSVLLFAVSLSGIAAL